jgi:hypothetical protein
MEFDIRKYDLDNDVYDNVINEIDILFVMLKVLMDYYYGNINDVELRYMLKNIFSNSKINYDNENEYINNIIYDKNEYEVLDDVLDLNKILVEFKNFKFSLNEKRNIKKYYVDKLRRFGRKNEILVERYDLVDIVNKDYLVRGLIMMLDDIERNDNKLLNVFKKFINGIKVNFDEDRIYFNDLRKFINRNFKNDSDDLIYYVEDFF